MGFLQRFMMSTRPPGDDIYEVLVAGEDSVGVLNKVTAVLSQNNVNFVSAHGQVDESGKTFVNAFFCEMAKAKVTPEELRKRLAALPFVKEVRVASLKGAMYESFMFPLSAVFAGRALMLGANAFSAIEERLVEIFGTAGEVMAYEQGMAYSVSTLSEMEGYREKVGAEWDLDNIVALLRAQGWAIAEIAEVPEGYEVKLTSLPGENRRAGGLSRFLTGMVVGMLEHLSGQRLAADPTTYEPSTKTHAFLVRKPKGGRRN
jgi:predicted amino acid-binding ACT domain protein